MTDARQSATILIRGGRIYDHDGDVHQPATGDLLVSAGRIERIAPRIDAPAGAEVIDASNKLVVPGLVNAHYHSHDVLMKGLFEEAPFDIWTSYTGAAGYGTRTHREVRIRTLIGAAEMLRNGITTVQDFLTVYPVDESYVDTVLSAYDEAGIRVNFAIAARDKSQLDISPLMAKDLPEAIRDRIFGRPGRTAQQELDFVSGQIKRLGMTPRPLITWALAPSAPQRCSPELLAGMAALSRDHKLPVFTHVYETRPQAAAAKVLSVSLLNMLKDAGLLNERLNLVHGVWLSPGDIEMLASARARVVHNPISNLKLKSGAAPILDLAKAGVEVALGCDNYSCAETQNIFIAMRMLCLLPAITSPEPHPITAARALKAATLTGAKAVNMEGQIGALKPGMAADLMILDLKEPAFVPFNSAARQLVFSESGGAIDTVLVAGRTVVRGHKLLTIDETTLAAEAEEISPGFRREVEAQIKRNADLIAPLLDGNRAVWKTQLGIARYVGGPKDS
jgi:cytosine/adenosine deaminase-related metal-dependent hydrolase